MDALTEKGDFFFQGSTQVNKRQAVNDSLVKEN